MAGVPFRDAAMSQTSPGQDEPEERPGWLYPLILFGITAVIGAVILFLYLGPDIDQLTGNAISPTTEANTVRVTIGGENFAMPSNYIRQPAARSGGAMDHIDLDALLPDLHGFSVLDEDAVKDVTRTSPVMSIQIKAGAPELSERERFERIYARNAEPEAKTYDYAGLTVTRQSDASGYAGQDAFSAELEDGFVVFLCTRDVADHEIGGLCQRETALGENLTLTYAFRGGHLRDWREIDEKVRALVARFAEAAQ